jgi:hypothetical protein
VIASAILLNVLATARALLHVTAKAMAVEQKEVFWGGVQRLLWNPLVLADEAHSGVKPQIRQANAAEDRTINLQLSREENILHQLIATLQLIMKGPDWLRQMKHSLPESRKSYQLAVGGKTASRNVSCCAASVQIRLQPMCPALFAHRMLAAIVQSAHLVPKERKCNIIADHTSWASISKIARSHDFH